MRWGLRWGLRWLRCEQCAPCGYCYLRTNCMFFSLLPALNLLELVREFWHIRKLMDVSAGICIQKQLMLTRRLG